MMNNKKLLTSYIIIVLLTILFLCFETNAVTEDELRNKQNDIEQQIINTNTEIAGIKENMTASLDQINRLNIQIKEYEDSLEDANEQLEELNIQLEEKNKELEDATNNYNAQKKKIEQRLIAIYESSKTTYLDILLGSTSLSDFFTKYYILEELAEYDNKLLQSMDVYETAVAIKSNLVEQKRDEAKSKKDFIEAKTGSMEVLITDKNNLVQNLSQKEIELNEQLEQFEIDKKEIEKELIEIAKKNKILKSVTPSQSGYISPLPGKTKENITTGYNGYSGHTGVDFAIPLGTDVLAAKSGTVVISEAKKNANGAYRSYGEYIAIDHHDGTMTLYAHGSPDSRLVQEGDEVVQRTSNYEIWNYWKLNRTTFAL